MNTLTDENVKDVCQYVENFFRDNFKPGYEFAGSMNVADRFYNRDDVRWNIAERLYYVLLQDYEITIDRDSRIVRIVRVTYNI